MTLYDCGMALLHPQAANYFLNGKRPAGTGNPHPNLVPYDKYPDQDLRNLHRSGNNGQFRKMREMHRPAGTRGRSALSPTTARRNVNRVALTEVLAAAFAEHDGNELSMRLIRGWRAGGPGAAGGSVGWPRRTPSIGKW